MQTASPTFTGGAIPSVYTVIVNWNGCADTLACIESLLHQDRPNLHIIVVDNGSTDGSVTRIRAAYPQVSVLEAGANLGFGTATNMGMRHAYALGADYVWPLNNDTTCPPDTCTKLVAKATANPSAGIIGSVLYRMDKPAEVQAWGGGELNTFLGRSRHFNTPTPLGRNAYLTFASVLIPRSVLERVGILYEAFFLYWEDADLSLRVSKAGYSLVVAEDTAVLHKEGGSSTGPNPMIDRYSAAGGFHFLRRHSPLPVFSMAIFFTVRVLARAIRRQPANVRAIFDGFGDYRKQRRCSYTDQL